MDAGHHKTRVRVAPPPVRLPAPAAAAPATRRVAPGLPSALLRLQRTIGNRAVAQMMRRAKRAAPRAKRPMVVQCCGAAHCRGCDGSHEATEQAALPARVAAASRSSIPLEPDVRRRIERAMGLSVGPVSIHADAEADRLARAVGAQAFTIGNSIYFRDGTYAPHSERGLHLLAHELTHVGQQGGDSVAEASASPALRLGDPSDAFEAEADCNADHVVARVFRGEPAASTLPIQRVPAGTALMQRKVFAQIQDEFRATFSPQGAVTGTGLDPAVDLGYAKDDDKATIHNETIEIPENTSGSIDLTVFTSWGSSHVLPPPGPQRSCEPCDLLDEKLGASVPIIPTIGIVDLVSAEFKQACRAKRNFADKARFTRKLLDSLEKDPCALKETAGTVACNATRAAITAANKNPLIPGAIETLEDQVKAISARLGGMEALCEEDPLEVMTGGGRTQSNATFAFDDEGKLRVTGPAAVTNSRGAGAKVEAESLKETDAAGGALASLTATIRYTNVRTVGDQQIPNATTFTQQFNVVLKKPVPPPDVPVHCGDQLKPFRVASDKLEREDHEVETLFDWFMCLPAVVRDEVTAGNLPIRVTGFASRTGGNAFNLNLGQKRADKAEKLIRGFAGTRARIDKFVFGEEPAPDEGKLPKKEDPNQRRADIEIVGTVPGQKAGGLTADTACGVNGPFVPNGGEEPARQDCLDNDNTPEASDALKTIG